MVCRQSVEAIKGFLAIIFAVLSGSENFCGHERIRIKPNANEIQDQTGQIGFKATKSK
jgi:hypothetical protein